MSHSATALWQRAMPFLREKIPEQTIKNWLVDAVPEHGNPEGPTTNLTLRVPSSFCKDYLAGNFRQEITEAVEEAEDGPVSLTLVVDASVDREAKESPSPPNVTETPSSPNTKAPNERSANTSDTSRVPSSQDPAEEPSLSSAGVQEALEDRPSASPTVNSRSKTEKDEPAARAESPSPRFPASDVRVEERRSTAHERRPPDTVSAERRPTRIDDTTEERKEQTPFRPSSSETNLRPEFTFERFLEGDSNRLARSASVAVAKRPGDTDYNPLVVYGEVGLGKTHLAQAIANFSVEHATAEKVCYVSSERFTSEFVTAIRNDNFSAFSDHYRSVDLLIVDDIQFLEGKEKTQEEFFHLFDNLHQHGKQIVLCADRPPSRIDGIEERLLSRFQWGLTADIQPPDLEMRLAVLQLKAENLGLDLAPDVYDLIAENITENVRQLEGALKQLSAHAQLIDGNLGKHDVQEILGDEIGLHSEPRQPKVDEIVRAVAHYHSLSPDDLIARGRQQKISDARQIAMYFSRELTDLSYASIGRRFGGRDHSTVIHACRKVRDYIDVQSGFEDELNSIRSEIRREVRSA